MRIASHGHVPEDPRASERCEFCQGPLYRVSLLDGTLEALDHRDCVLLSEAA